MTQLPNAKIVLGILGSLALLGIGLSKGSFTAYTLGLGGVTGAAGTSITAQAITARERERQRRLQEQSTAAHQTEISGLNSLLQDRESAILKKDRAISDAVQQFQASEGKAANLASHLESALGSLSALKDDLSILSEQKRQLESSFAAAEEAEQQAVDLAIRWLRQEVDHRFEALSKRVDHNAKSVQQESGPLDCRDEFLQHVQTVRSNNAEIHSNFLEDLDSLRKSYQNGGLKVFCEAWAEEYRELAKHDKSVITGLMIKRKSVLEETANKLLKDISDGNLVPSSEVVKIKQQYEARLSEFSETSEDNLGSIHAELDETSQDFEEQLDEALECIKMQAAEIALLKTQLSQATELKLFSDRKDPHSKVLVGNSVIRRLQEWGVRCDASPDGFEKSSNDLVTFKLYPRESRDRIELAQREKEFEQKIKHAQAWYSVDLRIEESAVLCKVAMENNRPVKVKREDVLKRDVSEWELYAASAEHIAIFARTQSGKTTLVDELSAAMVLQYGGANIHAITRKNDGARDIALKPQSFIKPQYMADDESYFHGMSKAAKEMEARNRILQAEPAHEFKKSIYVWDEYGEHYRSSREEIRAESKKVLISTMQRGAGQTSQTGRGITAIFMAQVGLVSTLGLNKPDLQNATLIVIGKNNITTFLAQNVDYTRLSDRELDRVKAELEVFSEKSEEALSKAKARAKVEGLSGPETVEVLKRVPEQYYSLVIPSGDLPAQILYNPAPGHYTNEAVKLVEAPRQSENANSCDHLWKKSSGRKTLANGQTFDYYRCSKCKAKKKVEVEGKSSTDLKAASH